MSPPLAPAELVAMGGVLRDHFEQLKRIFRRYCTHDASDASAAFALGLPSFKAFLADCRLLTSPAAAAAAFAKARAARVRRGEAHDGAADAVLNLREFLGVLARLAGC